MLNRPLGLRLDKQTLHDLKKLAEDRGTTKAELLRRGIRLLKKIDDGEVTLRDKGGKEIMLLF